MGFTQVLAVLKSRRRALFAVWGGVVLLALVVSLVLPRQYLASAEVVVEPRGGDQLASQPGSSGTTPGFLATQADIIASERVGARAVAALKLAADPRWAGRWQKASSGQGDANRWIAGRLKKNVKVSPSHESNVLTLTVTADDPRFAADYANALARAYLDTDRELSAEQARQSALWFDAHADQLRSQLQARRDEPGARPRETDAGPAYALALAHLAGSRLEGAPHKGSATLLSAAVAPTEATGPRPLRNLALAIVIGGLCGVAVTLVRERLDRRIRGADDLAAALGAPVLARVDGGAAPAPQQP